MNSKKLYITYDGILDQLGGSQILPYVRGLAKTHGGMHILSFEKPERFAVSGNELVESLAREGIAWTPLRFTRGGGIAGKIWDLLKMYIWGIYLACANRVSIVHTRGHPSAQIGVLIKWLSGARFIFDFRGLWVDERVDKGGWNLAFLSHRIQYRIYKWIERILLSNADHVIVLTEAVVPEVVRLGGKRECITVIPCCADFDHFPLATDDRRLTAREQAGIAPDAFVIGYLGSVGKMYMLDRFFRFFEFAAGTSPSVCCLVITQDIAALDAVIRASLPASLRSRVHVRSASREEVPVAVAAMDLLVSFVAPSYARLATSPTKLAECYAAGIPALCNSGVGDVSSQLLSLDAGVVVDPFSDADLAVVADALPTFAEKGGQALRDRARAVLGLEVANERYSDVYTYLEKSSC